MRRAHKGKDSERSYRCHISNSKGEALTSIIIYDIATKTRNGEPGGFPMIKAQAA
jgi:hypothetical protein